jgi:DNA-binding transcriptional LysR family regulator
MRAKILAQRDGLGVGWVPLERARGFLKRGELVPLQPTQLREPNHLYIAWRGDAEGRALQWWVSKLSDKRLAKKLVAGIAV